MELESEYSKLSQTSVGIIYGNISFYLGKKANSTSSHKWVCYVRGYENRSISHFVQSVTFTLHPSFKDPVRAISEPPFEIHEVGWGEFDIGIKITFYDQAFKDVEINHLLKLHPTQANINISTKKPVISEQYDEIVFVNPSETFLKMMKQYNENQVQIQQYQIKQEESKSQDDETSLDKNYLSYLQPIDIHMHTGLLEDAIFYINHELKEFSQKLQQIDHQLIKLNQESINQNY